MFMCVLIQTSGQTTHFQIDNGDYSTPYEDMHKGAQLTRADLEEYVRSYDEVLKPHHQHQGSYAQSEGNTCVVLMRAQGGPW